MDGDESVEMMRKGAPCAKSAARARWWRTFPVVVCALLVAHAAQASDESHANRLFVEAAKRIQAAEEEPVAARKFELLNDAKHKLEAIVDRHPSSRLAVELVSGQNIGTVSLPGLADAIEDAAVLACPQAPNPACLLSLAVATAGGKVEFDFFRDWALSEIVTAQAMVGYIKDALATVEKIEGASYRVSALEAIAAVQAENGDVKGAETTLANALEAAEMIKDVYRPFKLAAIAKIQAKAGYFKEAFATMEKIEDPETQTRTLAGIAEVQAGNGDVRKAEATLANALVTAETLENVSRAWAFAFIAKAQAKAGYLEKALATTEKIERAASRAAAFAFLAEAQARNGDIRKAEEFLANALEAAGMIEDADYRPHTLGFIAEAQAKTGNIEGAFSTANSIPNADDRAKAFAWIAVAAADTN